MFVHVFFHFANLLSKKKKSLVKGGGGWELCPSNGRGDRGAWHGISAWECSA